MGTSIQQEIDVEQYEEQHNRLNARRLEEEDRLFEQFRQQRERE